MKTTTVVHLSEYKKLSTFEKKMVRFFKNKSWLFFLIPISFYGAIYLSVWQHTFWYIGLYVLISFFTALALLEKYCKVSDTTNHCDECNSRLKYLGKDYYSDFYCCDNCNCKEYKKDIEY